MCVLNWCSWCTFHYVKCKEQGRKQSAKWGYKEAISHICWQAVITQREAVVIESQSPASLPEMLIIVEHFDSILYLPCTFLFFTWNAGHCYILYYSHHAHSFNGKEVWFLWQTRIWRNLIWFCAWVTSWVEVARVKPSFLLSTQDSLKHAFSRKPSLSILMTFFFLVTYMGLLVLLSMQGCILTLIWGPDAQKLLKTSLHSWAHGGSPRSSCW